MYAEFARLGGDGIGSTGKTRGVASAGAERWCRPELVRGLLKASARRVMRAAEFKVQERKSAVRNRFDEASQAVRLVVVENGADVRDFDTLDPGADGVHIIKQGSEEAPIELASRAIERLANIERTGIRLEQTLLLVSGQFDEQSAAARELLARALLTHASVAGAAELVLALRADADPNLRSSVLSLVEMLMGEQGAAAMPIKIRFGGQGLVAPSVTQVRSRGPSVPGQLRAFSALRGRGTAIVRGSSR